MDSVVFDGVEYVKASEVAKRFKYTSDYVGQLCRGKKVDARLVGRTWFVNPDSLTEHKGGKRSKATADKTSRSNDSAIKTKTELVKVNSPLKNKTAKRISASEGASDTEEHFVKISYEQDQESLIPSFKSPEVKQKPVPKFVRIEPAQAKKIKISGSKKKVTTFKSEGLPEVALSGKLSVSTYDDVEEAEPIDDAVVAPVEITEVLVPEAKVKPAKVVSMQSVAPKTNLSTKPATFVPKSVINQPKKLSPVVLLSPLISTAIAAVIALAIFAASSQTTVSSDKSSSGITLQTANLLEIINR